VTLRQRTRYPLFGVALAVAAFFVASPAYPSGFQVMTQGARAMGMGLAFTAVADDPTAIFYNPAGLSFQDPHAQITVGGGLISRLSSDFNGTNPYPGPVTEHVQKQNFFVPEMYASAPVDKYVTIGIGLFSPYGLGLRWQNAELFTGGAGTSPVSSSSFSGRFISQNAVIQTMNFNPVVSFIPLPHQVPELSMAVGFDIVYSKIMLESNQAAVNPFTNSVVDVAHVKLNGSLWDNHAFGFNTAVLWKPTDMVSVGISYRSKVVTDYDLKATFKQRPTGSAAFDALVATQLPQGVQPATTTIALPASLQMGLAVHPIQPLTVSVQFDWTQWSLFKTLDVSFTNIPGAGINRENNWHDAWAYRGGLQYMVTKEMAVRAGYYYDKTPQPASDVGPILADNTRDAFTFGFGYNTETWGVDVGDVYIKFHKRDATTPNTDNFYGTYKETANVGSINFRYRF